MEESTENEDSNKDRLHKIPTIEEINKTIDMILQSYFNYNDENRQNKHE